MPPHALRRPALLALCACVLVAQSMVAAINLLIPQLSSSSVHPSHSDILWTVDAYVIAFAGLLIPAGALGDRRGRKGALLVGLALFAGGAATSALAGAPAVLITGRALSGAGAALITPATMSILLHLSAPEHRPRAMAAWTLAIGLGGAAGNLGGGLVGQYLSWRALFAVMIPLAVVLAAAVAVTVPRVPGRAPAGTPTGTASAVSGSGSESGPRSGSVAGGERRPRTPGRAQGRAPEWPPAGDPLGTLLLVASLVAFLFGIIEGSTYGWAAPRIVGAFATGALLAVVFTLHSMGVLPTGPRPGRPGAPLFDPRVFASSRLRSATLGTATGFFGLFALFFLNSQYLQDVKGFSPAATGFAIIPLTVGMALVPKFAARWAGHPRPVIGTGLALIGVGLLGVSTAGAGTPYWAYACWLLVVSAGTGLSMPALTMGVVAALPHHQAGLGSGLGTTAREIGAALGVAVTGTVLASHPTLGDGMAPALRTVAVLVLAATAIVVAGYGGKDDAPTTSTVTPTNGEGPRRPLSRTGGS